ncbi:MAG: TIGR00153 family protein [Gammaproteobacteria bacterium]|jgi:uncharacterized protein|nr:TIGR00153 family protein [Gammaproteobacteria bacterium]MBT4495057.1 TIGR00153 family protein [Gammaproteobacteria bacterium]MBT7371037.1 TIGR00153 family protein [Gammaproteobacteria bacterium]
MSGTPIFSKLFGRSPIAPIQQHMSTCDECAHVLIPYFEAVLEGDWEKAVQSAERITELEREADSMKKNIRLNLPRSLFMPVSRDHLLEIVQIQDKLANLSKDIAGLILGRQMGFPPAVHEHLRRCVVANTNAVRFAREVMDELNDLIVTGFSGQEIEFIEKILDQLDYAEHDSDLRLRELRHKLYEIEESLDPIEAMFVYKVIELVSELADEAQTVGNRMMYLIAS